jgi:hypothetical protein
MSPRRRAQELRWAWQRLTRGWDDCAVWSIDWHLATYVPIWIRRLRDTKVGIPAKMFDDPQRSSAEDLTRATKRWDRVLGEIADGFEAARTLLGAEYAGGAARRELRGRFERAMDLLKAHYFDLRD